MSQNIDRIRIFYDFCSAHNSHLLHIFCSFIFTSIFTFIYCFHSLFLLLLGFNTAFRAGSVLGFALPGLGILILYLMLLMYATLFEQDQWTIMMDSISGYGLGGSSVALFGRVGGGIYTKAADVGADLVGKVVHGIPEDSPRNPATIADNVGTYVRTFFY